MKLMPMFALSQRTLGKTKRMKLMKQFSVYNNHHCTMVRHNFPVLSFFIGFDVALCECHTHTHMVRVSSGTHYIFRSQFSNCTKVRIAWLRAKAIQMNKQNTPRWPKCEFHIHPALSAKHTHTQPYTTNTARMLCQPLGCHKTHTYTEHR